MIAGNQGCFCSNSTSTLASLAERSCVIIGTGETGVLVKMGGPCVPLSYGSSWCLQHDRHGPECRLDNPSAITPGYCFRPWCFVDFETCGRDSKERIYRSSYFDIDSGVDLFYSYSTCNSTADDWLEADLKGVSIRANIPAYHLPWVFKRNPNHDIFDVQGSEYYDNNIPFEGIMIDYVERILEVSRGDIVDITYTHRTRASGDVHPLSSFDAAVQEVEDGLVDMSVGNFWITSERLKMAAFTVPLYYDKTFLVIENPWTTGSFDQAMQVWMPFTVTLWMFIAAAIVLSSLLGIWFSDLSSLNDQGESRRRRRTLKAYLRLAVDSCLQKGMFFCSAGVEQDRGDTLPNKCLMAGFGFIILTCVSAYVANLAAFMTQQNIGGAITTMEGAMSNGWKICAYPAIRTELERAWPGANFVFDNSVNEEFGLLALYEKGNCQALAINRETGAAFINNAKFQERLCKNSLVFTSSLIIEIPIGFPIRPQLAPRFSSWMVHAERVNDVSIEKVINNYDYPRTPTVAGEISTCEIELSVVKNGDKYARIGINHMALPFIIFTACITIAITLQLVVVHQQNMPEGREPSWRSVFGRPSALVTTEAMRDVASHAQVPALEMVHEGPNSLHEE